ncbi:hypothetical protein KR044_007929 [Drosophila immigrans]|nr:hypothetical protein KR044_007929 [Drosophila immigrans]
MVEACEGALNGFANTRLKLQQILRRHEKIDAILQDVQERLAPIHFLLSISDDQSMLNITDNPADGTEKGLGELTVGNLNSPYRELKTLRYNMKELNGGEDSLENVPSGDWKKMLKDLDDWYIRMDGTESVATYVEVNRDAHVLNT